MSKHGVVAAGGAADLGSEKEPYSDPPPYPFLDTSELALWSLYRAVITEFMATLMFLYVSLATVIGYKSQSAAAADACAGVGYLGVAWSFGATIIVLVYCTGSVSGGHINPAVTLALLLCRKLSLVRAALYVTAQCLGAICGAALVKGVMGRSYEALGGGANAVADGFSVGGALVAELAGTFVLVYVVLSATDPKRTAHDSVIPILVPLPIGFAVFVVHLATIPITGTGINPARSLGAAVVYNQRKPWEDHWIFWVGPLMGATAAAQYHRYVLRGKGAKMLLSSFRSTTPAPPPREPSDERSSPAHADIEAAVI
ncbi:unnamed protein product [Alopecurus aequalis]